MTTNSKLTGFRARALDQNLTLFQEGINKARKEMVRSHMGAYISQAFLFDSGDNGKAFADWALLKYSNETRSVMLDRVIFNSALLIPLWGWRASLPDGCYRVSTHLRGSFKRGSLGKYGYAGEFDQFNYVVSLLRDTLDTSASIAASFVLIDNWVII